MPETDLPLVVVAGNIVLDLFPPLVLPPGQPLRDLLVGGQTIELGAMIASPGGVVPNTGIGLCKLGIRVRALGQVGSDFLGGELRRLLHATSLDSTYLTEVEGTTSYTIVLSPPGTDRIFLHHTGPARTFSAGVINWEAVAEAGLFHLGYPPLMPALYADGGAGLAEIMRHAKELGATTSLDMCMLPPGSDGARQDWHAIFRAALPYVDLLLPSIEELLLFLRPEAYLELNARADGRELLSVIQPEHFAELADVLLDMGVAVAGIKAGHLGMYARTAGSERLAQLGRTAVPDVIGWANRELWEPGFEPRRIVTATGAGDAAVAGFLAAFVRGCGPEDTIRYACALGAQSLEAADATSGIHGWQKTIDRIAAGWEKNHVDHVLPGSRFDEITGQWIGPSDALRQFERGREV